MKVQKGFTLIEILIVIAIIGVLSSLLMVNFIGVRQRGRDAQRKANIAQIQSALELYRADQGIYPTTIGVCGSSLQNPGLTATYLQKIPCDPLNTSPYIYTYTSVSGGLTYSIFSCLENTNDSQKDTTNNSTYCTGGTTNWSYTLQNP